MRLACTPGRCACSCEPGRGVGLDPAGIQSLWGSGEPHNLQPGVTQRDNQPDLAQMTNHGDHGWAYTTPTRQGDALPVTWSSALGFTPRGKLLLFFFHWWASSLIEKHQAFKCLFDCWVIWLWSVLVLVCLHHDCPCCIVILIKCLMHDCVCWW